MNGLRGKIFLVVIIFLVICTTGFYYLYVTASRLEWDDSQIRAVNYFGYEINSLPLGRRQEKITVDSLLEAEISEDSRLGRYLEGNKRVGREVMRGVEDVSAGTTHILTNERIRYKSAEDVDYRDFKTALYNKELEKLWEAPYLSLATWGRGMVSADGSRVMIVSYLPRYKIEHPPEDYRFYKVGQRLVVLNQKGEVIYRAPAEQFEAAALSPDGNRVAYIKSDRLSEPFTVVNVETGETQQVELPFQVKKLPKKTVDMEEARLPDTTAVDFSKAKVDPDRCKYAAKKMFWKNSRIHFRTTCSIGGWLWWQTRTIK
ncbi:MAG: hypothetical protein ACQEP7_03905 [bacterium]